MYECMYVNMWTCTRIYTLSLKILSMKRLKYDENKKEETFKMNAVFIHTHNKIYKTKMAIEK